MNADAADPRRWKRLYSLVSWFGIATDFALAIAFLFFPQRVLAAVGLSSEPITWVQLCGELITLIAIFYIPPALNVDRYRPHAWIGAVVARGTVFLLLATSVLVFGAHRAFLLGAALDLIIGGAQVFLLSRLQRAESHGGGERVPSGVATHVDWSAPVPERGHRPDIERWKKTYRWVSWLGIAANMLFVLPLVFAPHEMLSILGVGSVPVTWAQLAGLLLGIISIFYIPAIYDLDRYRLFAWLAIFPSRAFGVLFTFFAVLFLGANDAFLLGVVLDLPFAVAQTFILSRLERAERGNVERRRGVYAWGGWWREAVAVLATLLLLGSIGWHKLLREFPQQLADRTIEEFFKHGSIGAEADAGLPYWIWMTLPTVFPEYLPRPGGYAALGFMWEPGAELPIGFSRKKIGFDRVAINCTLCHSGSVQIPGEPLPRVYLGAPAVTARPLDYQRFLFRSARDPRFNAGTLLPAIDRQTRLSWIDRLLYRYVLIPASRRELQRQATIWEWTNEEGRPDWGPGRIEPFNPVKLAILVVADPGIQVGTTLGTSDMQPLWNLGAVPGRAFHWDGLNTDLREVVDSSALGDGATPDSIPRERLRDVEDWLRRRPAPPFPFPEAINRSLLARGEEVYRAECARCHAPDGAETGKVTPASGENGVGTDDNRAKMWTPESAAAYNAYLGNRSWRFVNFRSTGGYVNVPLDGLWIRAPYLHNGSVPTLTDLLEPPANRPARFWRGVNDYDPARGGFVSSGPKAEAEGFLYETSGRGNSNQGHLYGTTLPPQDKAALVEYLKTL